MARGTLTTDDLAGRESDAALHDGDPRDAVDPYPDEPAPSATEQPEQQEEVYAPLLEDREAGVFLDRWRDVQARFVDDPQDAVREGDSLVAELMQALAQRFSEQKAHLQETWDGGGEPETELLRQALKEYRSFFHRLLST